MNSAVLFVVFNRPETTARVFESIRSARPPRLYVAADGPRPGRAGEAARCLQVRSIATQVDWPCELHTLFREQNLGCKRGVSGAIDWFFQNEVEGIVLEDDVLPVPSFFKYCDVLLERYRDDARVGVISGSNLVAGRFKSPHSYFFSRYNHVWGWASWRRAWQGYDVAMGEWPEWRNGGGLRRMFPKSLLVRIYWRLVLNSAHRGEIDTWDYQWLFACWRQELLTALPRLNQTENIGFGPDATHTTSSTPDSVLESRPLPLDFPLVSPPGVDRDTRADELMDAHAFRITAISVAVRLLKSAARRIRRQ